VQLPLSCTHFTHDPHKKGWILGLSTDALPPLTYVHSLAGLNHVTDKNEGGVQWQQAWCYDLNRPVRQCQRNKKPKNREPRHSWLRVQATNHAASAAADCTLAPLSQRRYIKLKSHLKAGGAQTQQTDPVWCYLEPGVASHPATSHRMSSNHACFLGAQAKQAHPPMPDAAM
jgi:hypothetical protein